MPTARQALDWLAEAGDTWPGQRDEGAGTASGGIRIRLSGPKPVGQDLSQTERGPIVLKRHSGWGSRSRRTKNNDPYFHGRG